MSAEEERKRRIARNEALFREVNERIEEVSAEAPGEYVEFICECGNQDCTEVIELARKEYEDLRADPVLFAVKPGHVVPEVEFVVAENDRFVTARKFVAQEAVARETDPRVV